MAEAPSYRVRFTSALEVFEALPEIGDDMVSRPNGEASIDYVRGLLKTNTPEEAITFAAYLLSYRESVWWGHECLMHVQRTLDETDLTMLRLAEEWVRDPSEDQRKAAMNAGMEQEPKTPGTWIALAAGWSGGSMTDNEQAPVPPPAFLPCRAVNAGILSGLARLDGLGREKTLSDFISIALTIVEEE